MKHDDVRSAADIEDDPAAPEGEGFLGRWSRRKADARRTRDEDGAALPAEVRGGEGETDAAAQDPPGEPAPLPDPESLDENSDVSAFLSPEVGEELRRLALRRLFRMPKFNLRDGLDDYDEDYRSFEALSGIVTADMRHRMEREARRAAERLAEGGDAQVPGEETKEAAPSAPAQAPSTEAAEVARADPEDAGDAPDDPSQS